MLGIVGDDGEAAGDRRQKFTRPAYRGPRRDEGAVKVDKHAPGVRETIRVNEHEFLPDVHITEKISL
jgi:hypothetical protein